MLSKLLGLWLIIDALISIVAQELKRIRDFRRSAHSFRIVRIVIGITFMLL